MMISGWIRALSVLMERFLLLQQVLPPLVLCWPRIPFLKAEEPV
jgi:hypothetical protein